jgi:hypothetical protein
MSKHSKHKKREFKKFDYEQTVLVEPIINPSQNNLEIEQAPYIGQDLIEQEALEEADTIVDGLYPDHEEKVWDQQNQTKNQTNSTVYDYEFEENDDVKRFKDQGYNNRKNTKNVITIEDENSFASVFKKMLKFLFSPSIAILAILLGFLLAILVLKPTIIAPFLDSDKIDKLQVNYFSKNIIEQKLSGDHDIFLNDTYRGKTQNLTLTIDDLSKDRVGNDLKIRKIYNLGPFVFAGSETIFDIKKPKEVEVNLNNNPKKILFNMGQNFVTLDFAINRTSVDFYFNDQAYAVLDGRAKVDFKPSDYAINPSESTVYIPYYAIEKTTGQKSTPKNYAFILLNDSNKLETKCDSLAYIVYNSPYNQSKTSQNQDNCDPQSNKGGTIIITKIVNKNEVGIGGNQIKKSPNKLAQIYTIYEFNNYYQALIELDNGKLYNVSTNKKTPDSLQELETILDFAY